jgi:hypothetical protein
LGVVGATDGQKWRKETSKLNVRPVKRLRVTHLGEDEDKENVDYVGSKWDEDGLATPSPRRKALECGEPTGQATEQDQNMQASCQPGEHQGEDDHLDEANHDTASPELQACEPPEILGDVSSVEGDETASPPVLDMVLPSVEAADHGISLAAVTGSSPTSEPKKAMASSPRTPTKNLTAQTVPSHGDEQDVVASAHSTLGAVERPLEDENAAYLWAFLSRTRARKEAREQTEQNNAVQREEGDEAGQSKSLHVDKVSATTPELDDAPVALPAANPSNIILSPRRSSRLTTRLPRPQNPVSTPAATISLKRLNGPELTANNREIPSIAVATRRNTECNTFGAISVKNRLIQLAAEAKVRESSGVISKGAEPSSLESSTVRTKQKKVVWAETLATYQDGSDPLSESGLRDEAVNAEEVPIVEGKEGQPAEVEPDPCPDGDRIQGMVAEQSIQGLFQMLREKNKNRGGMKKVRRLRRLNGGSVNGTPAPKKFTNTQLPVPVGSKPSAFGSSLEAEKTKLLDKDGAKLEANASEGGKTNEGVQTRTRSRKLKNV